MLKTPVGSQKGFSLIELMIGLVIGLVVSAAMIAFMAATLKSNSETIQSMKLSNELRALTEIISRDLRRARGMQDPLANIGTNCSTTGTTNLCQGLAFNTLTISPANPGTCILYGYDSPDGNNFRAVRLSESGGVGRVVFDRNTSARSCSAGGTQISSDLIDVDSLVFGNCQYTDTSTSPATVRTLTDCITISVTGKLTSDPENITQTFSTSVGIRSGQIN